MRYSIELRTSETTAEVMEKISANTERELVAFVSAARQTGALGAKPFVASTSGNRFRVWRVPYARRGGLNSCYRYLRGEVRDVDGERHVVGSLALHPFQMIFALVPFVTAAVAAWLGYGTPGTWVFIALFCVMGMVMIGSAMQPHPQEETEILAFLRRLFPDAQSNVQ